MRSRTVRPIRQRGQKKQNGKKGRSSLGDTQPMRTEEIRRRSDSFSDTRPMRPVSIRSGYEGYQRVIDRRREVLRTPKPLPEGRAGNGEGRERRARPVKAQKRTGLAAVIAKSRSRAAGKEQYFDFDLLLVIIFLMCFGLVMLYSTSSYEAQADFGNDMYYFSKQALIGAAGFVIMFIVSKIDYHFYGAFALAIYVTAMILMALVQTPRGETVIGARRWIGRPANATVHPAALT